MWVRRVTSPGSPRRVLLVHGLGRGGAQLVPLALALRGPCSVLVPDLFDLGGRSRARSGALRIVEHAEALGDMLDGFGPADVVGISLGGWVGTWLAARRPDLVRSLYLVNPAGTRRDAEAVGDLYQETARSGELYRRVVSGRPFVGVPVLSALLQRGFTRVLQTEDVRALLLGVREEDFLEHAVPDVRCPVRLLLAENDRLLSATETRRVFAAIQGDLSGTWVEGASHNVGYEAFETLVEDLCAHLDLPVVPRTVVGSLATHLRVPPRIRRFAEDVHE